MGKLKTKWGKWRGMGAVLLALTGVGAPLTAVLLGAGDIVVQELDERQTEQATAEKAAADE